MIKQLLSFTLLLSNLMAFAQLDSIFKTDGTVIPCLISERLGSEVKYKIPSRNDNILFSTEKSNIYYLRLRSGEKLIVSRLSKRNGDFDNQNDFALKINMISPALGFIEIGGEKNLEPGISVEASLSVINIDNNLNGRMVDGYNLRFGYKVYRDPEIAKYKMRYAHVMKGLYLRTDLMISQLTFSGDGNTNPIERSDYSVKSNNIGISFNLGNQFVFNDAFVLDMFFGVGYGFLYTTNEEDYEFDMSNRYGWLQGPSEFPFNLGGGIKFGILF